MRRLLAGLLCSFFALGSVRAQTGEPAAWVTEVGVTSFQGGLHDTTGIVAGPGAGMIITLRRILPFGRFAVGLGASYQRTSWTAHIGDYFAGYRSEFKMLEFAPELRYSLWEGGTGTALLLHLGPTYQGWIFDDAWRGRIGASTGATFRTPIGRRLDLHLRGEATTNSSWVKDQETDAEIGKERMHRWHWSLGLAWHHAR